MIQKNVVAISFQIYNKRIYGTMIFAQRFHMKLLQRLLYFVFAWYFLIESHISKDWF